MVGIGKPGSTAVYNLFYYSLNKRLLYLLGEVKMASI